MKKVCISLIIILLTLTINCSAQLDYLFSASSRQYEPVVDGISPPLIMVPPRNANPPWTLSDEGFAQVPVGFTFNYDGKDVTKVSICANGFVTLGDTLFRRVSPLQLYINRLAGNPFYVDGVKPLLAPFWDDLDLVDTHNLVYKTTGKKPFRVFTVEWKKTRWTFESTEPALSMEVKLYEKTNVIEFLYKDEGGQPYKPRAFASIGITSAFSGRGFISLQDASSNPSLSVIKAQDSLTGKPANNQVYTFTPAKVNVPQNIFPSISYTNNKVSFYLKANGENKYEYAVTRSPISPTSGIETKSENLQANGLSAATTYYIYARAMKNKNFYSQWIADSFTTAVNPVELPWHISGGPDPYAYPYTPPDVRIQTPIGHSAGTHSDKDWTTLTDFPNVGDTSIWSLNTFYGETGDSWLFSPGLKLAAGKTYQLKFSYFSFFQNEPNQISSIEIKYGKATGAVAMIEGTLFKKDDITLDSYDDIALLKDTIIELTPNITDVYYIGFHNLTPFTGEYGNVVPVITNISVTQHTISTAMPLVLLGKTSSDNNVLEWKQDNKKQARSYEVQRSGDRLSFKTIKVITPRGNSKGLAEARSILKTSGDLHITDIPKILENKFDLPGKGKADVDMYAGTQQQYFKKLLNSFKRGKTYPADYISDYTDRNASGANYYRIKEVDRNGKVFYSNIVSLNSASSQGLKVYPNPAKDILNVRLPSGISKEVTLLVTDASGRSVLSKSLHGIKGAYNLQLDISRFNAGTYFIKIICGVGCDNAVMKFEKK